MHRSSNVAHSPFNGINTGRRDNPEPCSGGQDDDGGWGRDCDLTERLPSATELRDAATVYSCNVQLDFKVEPLFINGRRAAVRDKTRSNAYF